MDLRRFPNFSKESKALYTKLASDGYTSSVEVNHAIYEEAYDDSIEPDIMDLGLSFLLDQINNEFDMSDCDELEKEAHRLADNIIKLLKEKGIPQTAMHDEVVAFVTGNETEFVFSEDDFEVIDLYILGGTILEHLIGGSGFDKFLKVEQNNK